MSRVLRSFIVLSLLGLGFLIYAVPSKDIAYALTTTSTITQTVTGQAVPSGTTLGYGTLPFIVIISVMGLFVGLASTIKIEGGTNSFVIKLGLFLGSLVGMLSINSTAPTIMPLGLPIIAGAYLLTYLWKGV